MKKRLLKRKLSYPVLLMIFFISPIFGQNANLAFSKFKRIEGIGISLPYRNFQDEAISQQVYSGVGLSLNIQSFKMKGNKLKRYTSDFTYAGVSSDAGLSFPDLGADFNYSSLFRIGKGKITSYLGPQFNINAQVQIIDELDNSFLNWHVGASVGMGFFMDIKNIPFKGRWYNHLHIPVVQYLNRPKCGVVLDALQEPQSTLSIVGDAIRVQNEFGFYLPAKDQKRPWGSLFYRWNLFSWTDKIEHEITSAQHQLGIIFLSFK